MMRFSYRARLTVACGIVAIPLVASACNVKDQLLEPQQPGIILPQDVTGQTGADGLYVGALGRLKAWTVGGNVNQESFYPMASLMTDEYKSSDTFSQRNETDQRSVQTNDALTQSVYTSAQQARGFARDALIALQTSTPGQTGKIGEMYFAIGFTEMILAETFCNGLPFGEMKDGIPVYTAAMSASDALKVALSHIDSALTSVGSGTDAISTNVRNASAITKGRILVDLGQWAQAATAVAGVATAYQYAETFSTASTTDDNGFWIMTTNSARYSVGDSVDASGLIKNAIPFASAGDPRVPSAKNTIKPFDNQTLPYFLQTMFGRDDAIALVDGTDARLIEAEAKLQTSDFAGMMTILNALRAAPAAQGAFKSAVLPALPVPATKDAATNLYFREKAFWQFARGYRFNDLRRLVRQYGRTGDQAWPAGTFHKGGSYGPDVNWPTPDNEKTNPNFTGCTDRTA